MKMSKGITSSEPRFDIQGRLFDLLAVGHVGIIDEGCDGINVAGSTGCVTETDEPLTICSYASRLSKMCTNNSGILLFYASGSV